MKKILFLIFSTILLTSCDTKISDMIDIMERGNIICVDSSASTEGSGTSWKDPKQTIAQAVAVAHNGDEIWVKKGNYTETVTIDKDVTLIGGFDGDEEVANDLGDSRTELVDTSFDLQADVEFKNFEVNGGGGDSVFELDEPVSLNLKNSNFNSCHGGGNGGVIFTNGNDADIKIYECSFYDNRAVSFGGVIYCNSISNIDIKNSKFIINNGDSSGGVIYCTAMSNIRIWNSEFISNGSGGVGGGVISCTSSSNIEIRDSKFSGNHSTGNGGVICSDSALDLNIENSIFEKNFVDNNNGGVIYKTGTAGNITISDNCVFEGNGKDGNAIQTRFGGVIFIGPGSVINISNNCIFKNNAVEQAGGVISAQNGEINISSNCIFSNNFAQEMGGTIYSNNNELVISNGCRFENNSNPRTGNRNGGAIWHSEGNFKITNNCYFNSNSSSYGGAIYFNQCTSVAIDNNYFYNNTASIFLQGNAMYFLNAPSNLSEILSSNTFGPNDNVGTP